MASEPQITLAKATRLEHLPFIRGSAKQTDLAALRVGGINYPIIFPKRGHHWTVQTLWPCLPNLKGLHQVTNPNHWPVGVLRFASILFGPNCPIAEKELVWYPCSLDRTSSKEGLLWCDPLQALPIQSHKNSRKAAETFGRYRSGQYE